MITRMSTVATCAPGGPHLQAVVDVEAVAEPQRLVEAHVVHRPRREDQHASRRRCRPSAGGGSDCEPRIRGQLAAAVLAVANDHVADRRAALPPRDRAHAGGTCTAGDRHLGSLERAADLGAEGRIGEPSERVHEHQRLEVVAQPRRRRAAGCWLRPTVPTAANARTSESGSATRSIPGSAYSQVRLRLAIAHAEGDHRVAPRGRAPVRNRRQFGRRRNASRRFRDLAQRPGDPPRDRAVASPPARAPARSAAPAGSARWRGRRAAPRRASPRRGALAPARCRRRCPTPGIRPSHFSAIAMCAWTHDSGSANGISEWLWTALKSAVTTL